MFLKRLETVGFKSFAKRIQMDFVPGVTAVVGPNGSGKSNVIDAIRWVLGEQSAKSLRGQKMEDIIFQGSDTRNPLNFAEVTLLLNNEAGELPLDYQEVNVTRRVYRSGESEFLINNQACRLKDIIDLFMDTGLGRESFSIIGQGKIDEILSSKAEERRAVFEEAAGVLKYKQRKNKAEFKLLETADNLDRVEDIIYEIEQQIDPLKKQAEIAGQYKIKIENLKQIEVALLVTEIEALHGKWQALLSELEHDKLTEISDRTKIQEKDAAIENNRRKMHILDEAITDLQNTLLTITEQLEKAEGNRNVWKERSHHMEENKQKLKTQQENAELRIAQVQAILEKERVQLSSLKVTIQTSEQEINQLENTLSHGLEQINAEIEDLKSDYIEYLNEQAVLQNENQSIERQLKQQTQKEASRTSSYQDLLNEEQEWGEKKQEYEKDLAAETEKLSRNQAEISKLKTTMRIEREQLEGMQQKLYEGNEQIAKLTSRKEMLVEMKDSFQGFFYGVKEILRAKQRGVLTDIHGTVLDLIDVPTTYMTAIDTVLGAQAQYVVVPTDEVARSTIQWLKKENKGRATFLPIQSITAKSIPSSVLKNIEAQQGFLGVAADLVKTEERHHKVVQHLLGNVMITDHLENANAIAYATKRGYRIVTLEGDMVYPGGSMTGGAKKKNNQSLFTREKEVQLLTKKITDFSRRAATYSDKVQQQREKIESLEKNIAEVEDTIKSCQRHSDEKQIAYNDILLKYRTVSDELTTYYIQAKEQETVQIELEATLKQNHDKQAELQFTIAKIEKAIEKRTEEEQDFQTNEKNAEKQLHELEIKRTGYMERQKNHQQQIETQEAQLSELEASLRTTVEQLDEMMDETELSTLEAELEAEMKEYIAARERTSKALGKSRLDRQQLVQSTEDEEREVKGLYQALERFTKTIQEKEVQANRLDVALENCLATLQSEYTMTYEKAVGLYEKVADIGVAREKVATIKSAIERLGTVNLGAIDEYARLSERYSFLQEQQTDLLEAKKTLYEVIREMDEEMTVRFSAVFSDIQQAFTTVFQKLFGGGHAALTLTDPDNLLETGVDIMARPPGKKLKTLGLLSGGERALTAIALLFAILQVRPVPFCILDEVDAALDEANVDRFGSYLQSFSKNTQFIVITHRKGTMEQADALYGITMQESGVSRLVSVKLEDTSRLVETS